MKQNSAELNKIISSVAAELDADGRGLVVAEAVDRLMAPDKLGTPSDMSVSQSHFYRRGITEAIMEWSTNH